MSDFFQSISFGHPYYILGALVPVMALVISYIITMYSTNRYCDKELLSWVIIKNKNTLSEKLYLSKIIPLLIWFLLCIALTGPRIKIDERSLVPEINYNNAVVFVLDVSGSMLVEDIYPDRITRAKLVIDTLLANSNNILTGLVIYAYNAHMVIPLTYDSNVIRDVLPAIQSGMLPIEGSNYIAGLNTAAAQLTSSRASSKTIIMFSDGDFGQIESASPILNLDGIKVNVFGVGTDQGLPVPNKNGGWMTKNNKAVISRLNEVRLNDIARKFNGQFKTISVNVKLEEINLQKLTGPTITPGSAGKTIIIWKQLYQWFLVPAVILFFISTLNYRRKTSVMIQSSPWLVVGLSALLLYQPSSADAADQNLLNANAAYHVHNFIIAEKLYKKSNSFIGLMGQANSVYRQKNYTDAIHLYTQAVLKAPGTDSRATALFNLANTYYMLSDYSQSIELYRDVLRYNPAHAQAKINLEYARVIDKRIKMALALRSGKKRISGSQARVGMGPRSERIEQGVDTGNSKVTLSTDEDSAQTLYSLPLNNGYINELIERGIKHSKISTTKIDTSIVNSEWEFEHTTLDMVELLVKQEKLNNHNLWKRLFEIEEGFPAPVETPHVKPGVEPW